MKLFVVLVAAALAADGTLARNLRKERERREVKADGTEVRSLHIESRVVSRFATTHVRSEVVNTDLAESKEVFFTAQLPAEAFITNFTMLVDGRLEVAEVKGKEEAKREYERAKSTGQTAGLVAQKARETEFFRTSVNVKAGGKVNFDLTYQQVLQRRHGVYKNVLNLISTKGIKNVKLDVYITERGKVNKLKIPQFAPKIGVKTNKELLALPENSQAVVRSSDDDGVSTTHVSFTPAPGKAGQLAVLYDVERSTQGGELEVVDGYFVHFFAPQANFLDDVSADFVFVLDKSGSMSGRKFSQMQEAMETILPQLKEEDSFSIVYFSRAVDTWMEAVQPATPENVESALEFVRSMWSGGDTNIHGSLLKAIDILENSRGTEDQKAQVIVFLTDGRPTVGWEVQSAEGIKEAVRARRDGKKWKLHTLAFGDDADETMLKQLSKENKGLYRKIFVSSDAALQLDGFYSEISVPLFTDVDIVYLNGSVDATSVIKNRDDATLYEGSEIVVVGKLRDPAVKNVHGIIAGKTSEGAPFAFRSGNECFSCCTRLCPGFCGVRFCDPPPFPHLIPPRPVLKVPSAELPPQSLGGFVERMWAYQTIKKNLLEAELQPEKRTQLRNEAKRLALQYNFVTELTSLVIVDKEAELKPIEEEDSRADLAPSFPASSFLGFPAARLLPPAGLGAPGSAGRPGGFAGGPALLPQIPPMRTRLALPPAPSQASTLPVFTFANLNLACPKSILIVLDDRSGSHLPNQKMSILVKLESLLRDQPRLDGILSIALLQDGGAVVPWYQKSIKSGAFTKTAATMVDLQSMLWDIKARKADQHLVILSGKDMLPASLKNFAKNSGVDVTSGILYRDRVSWAKISELQLLDSTDRPLYSLTAAELFNRLKC